MFAIAYAAIVGAILVTSALLWRHGAALPAGGASRLLARILAGMTGTIALMLAAGFVIGMARTGYPLTLSWGESDRLLRGLAIMGLPIVLCNLGAWAILYGLASRPGGIEMFDRRMRGDPEEEEAEALPKPLPYKIASWIRSLLFFVLVAWVLSQPGWTAFTNDDKWVVSLLLGVMLLFDAGLKIARPGRDAAARTNMAIMTLVIALAYLIYGWRADGAHAWTADWRILRAEALFTLSIFAHFAIGLAPQVGRWIKSQ